MASRGPSFSKSRDCFFPAKSHDQADEVRAPKLTRVKVVRLAGFTLGRFKLDPGWRWSECVKPVVGTATSCPMSHTSFRAASLSKWTTALKRRLNRECHTRSLLVMMRGSKERAVCLCGAQNSTPNHDCGSATRTVGWCSPWTGREGTIECTSGRSIGASASSIIIATQRAWAGAPVHPIFHATS
jgi:hypothetical protein